MKNLNETVIKQAGETNAPERVDTKIMQPEGGVKTVTKHPWVKTAKEIMALELKEVPMLLAPIIPKYGIAALAGSSDLGKSYFLLQLCEAIVKGDDKFLDFPLNTTYKSAIYVTTEDDEFSLCPRLLTMAKENSGENVYDCLRVVSSGQDLINRLGILLKEQPVDVVVIDTLADIYDGDPNQSNKIRAFLQEYKRLADEFKTAIIFNHHCGKKNDFRAPHKDNLLGSQGFESSMRAVLELRRDFNDNSKRHLCIVKGNYIKDAFKDESFVLNFDYDGTGFTNTGGRTPFGKLAKLDGNDEEKAARDERIFELRDEKLSYAEISEKLKKEGITLAKSTIGDICKKRPVVQLPKGNHTDGQSKEAA